MSYFGDTPREFDVGIEIVHHKGLNYTPAACLAARVQAELISTNQSEPVLSVGWDDNAILAVVDGKAIGIITWIYSEWAKTVSIHLGWVDPEYRRKGVYLQMWKELVQKARDSGAKNIIGTTHMDNHAMRKTAKALGRTELSVNMVYRL
jgi:GNAT superfamily N-acetyltransferase